ncbi:ANTAR domain-containing protein [Streptomyces sp. NPDC005408]|uniref:ANTAR domain-containing protein n=1 Tax=Streptomyces sp. NPDC005408 TaxID=3155341 RepID=UPI00339EB0CB
MARINEPEPALEDTATTAWAASDETRYRLVGAELESQALREEVEGLRRALRTHPVIDMARGIIMATASCTPNEAWQVLVHVSQHTNVKLRDIAQRIVDAVGGPPPPRPVRTALRSALAALPDSTAR